MDNVLALYIKKTPGFGELARTDPVNGENIEKFPFIDIYESFTVPSMQFGTKLVLTAIAYFALNFFEIDWMIQNFKFPMRFSTIPEILTYPAFIENFLTRFIRIWKFNDISAEILPTMGVNAFLVVVFPINGTKLGFVFKEQEIVIEINEI